MSVITREIKRKSINFDAIEKIRAWFVDNLDEDDLNIPLPINNLARETRKVGKITKRANQPYLEKYILRRFEEDGICNIDNDEREVTFIKLPNKTT
jgi:hypothetical protein